MPTKHLSANAKKKGWKDIQSKARRSRQTKLAVVVLGLVIGLVITSWVIRFTQSLFSPWKLSVKAERNYIWDDKFNINLLLRTNQTSIFSYNPTEKKIVILNIPDETFLEVPKGFGFWQLRAVDKLGGDTLLVDTLRNFLGIPIDGFLDFSGPGISKSAVEIVEELRQNPFSGFNLMPSLKTDLTLWELVRLKLSITGVRFDKVAEISLDKQKILNKETLPDGTEVLTADPVKLDSVLVNLVDPAFTFEHKAIAIWNATNRPLLAQKAARLITNMGGNVIITSNAEEKLKKTTVYGEKSASLKRLKQIFALDDKISSSSANLEFSRAEINIFLGEDFDK
ncbi:MAG: LCP family protein [Candidatus Daviesbacteria bacterium]|nr:LCP family protein [Candidatus Daviesbacteria bacterium]